MQMVPGHVQCLVAKMTIETRRKGAPSSAA